MRSSQTQHERPGGGPGVHSPRSASLRRGSLAWGITWAVLGILVVLPLAAVTAKAVEAGPAGILAAVSGPIARSALLLSFGAAFAAATVNTVMGTLVAWVLVRYEFLGKSVVNSLVDIPFALPTAVAGITLSELLGPKGWVGHLSPALAVAYTPVGILVAMTFVSLPFAVRAVQPVLQDLESDVEEAANLLGADRLQTFAHVILPTIRPAMLTGLALGFARAVGEFGSVVIISGNIPLFTLTGPVLIYQRLEQYDSVGATGIAVVMLLASLATLVVIGLLQPGRPGNV